MLKLKTVVFSSLVLLLQSCASLSGGNVFGSLFVETDHIQTFVDGQPQSKFEKLCEINMVEPAFNGGELDRKISRKT